MSTGTLTAQQSYTVVPAGAGPKFWLVGDRLSFKVGQEQTGGRYTLAEAWIPPGGGPPPHVHHAEDEMFYLLEGTIQFTFEDRTYIGHAGDAVYLPKGRVHTFKNIGTEGARFLVTATSCNFERFAAEAGYAVSTLDEEPQVSQDEVIARLLAVCPKYDLEVRPDHKATALGQLPAGRELWVLGQHVNIKLTSEQTGGTFSVAEITGTPGTAVPPHVHVAQDEMFFVQDGTFEFTIGGETVAAPAGTFIHVPAGVSHGFRAVGPTPAKMVDYHTPGGFEKFFEECGTPCTDRTKPPAFAPPSVEQLKAILEKHGMTLA
jgi:quercetin dioxygenase-like cupin family protein